MAAKFFTGLPLDGPDPECVKGHGEQALANLATPPTCPGPRATTRTAPARPVAREPAARSPLTISRRPPDRACDENPLAGLALDAPLAP